MEISLVDDKKAFGFQAGSEGRERFPVVPENRADGSQDDHVEAG